MAATDQSSSLMDIASTLSQDDIPFKLRCACCNKLALNAFRLPCCDQAICENCQTALPDTCPVCAHTPISPDLCKPNKALRTTLKAFLRTEEKKREKERQSAAAAAAATEATAVDATPAQQATPAPSTSQNGHPVAALEPVHTAGVSTEEAPATADAQETGTDNPPANVDSVVPENGPQDEQMKAPADGAEPTETAEQSTKEGEADGTGASSAEQESAPDINQTPVPPQSAGPNMPMGMAPNMAWNSGEFNPMLQFMGNNMFGFPNPMAMPGMAMDPMAASQGMFGGYGMNMSGMNNGMNMDMSYDAGQGMYGGWDGSQNSMWNGGQDKFNPNAFANGMGPPYGGPSGFGGYNVSQMQQQQQQQQQQQFSNQEFQNGYYGPGFGRGNHHRGQHRGFGRGQTPSDYPPNTNGPARPTHNSLSGQDQSPQPVSTEDPGTAEAADPHAETPQNGPNAAADASSSHEMTTPAEIADAKSVSADAAAAEADDTQLRGIPTIDSLDQANAMSTGPMGMPGYMGPGFDRGYMRGPFQGGRGGGFGRPPFMQGPGMSTEPRGQGVVGAPAAPRAMRQGLPNTSVYRQRNLPGHGRSSVPPTKPSEEPSQRATPATPQEEPRPSSRSRSRSKNGSVLKPRSRSRSPNASRADSRRRYRQRTASVDRTVEDSDRRRERPRRPDRDNKYDDPPAMEDGRRTRSPSLESHRSSRRRDRRSGRRSRRAGRRRSPSRNADSNRLSPTIEEKDTASRAGDTNDTSSRGPRNSKDKDRERDRDMRRRDRDRERERDRYRERYRDREREREKDRERDRDRDRDVDRDRPRDRDRDRDRDRKRSRRDRSASPANSDFSRHHTSSRRSKRARDEGSDRDRDQDRDRDRDRDRQRSTREKDSSSAKPSQQSDKDPHTLEREARNRERLLKEQQRREAMQSDNKSGNTGGGGGRRRERGGGNRRMSYKYEDEEDGAARTARVENEREAERWS